MEKDIIAETSKKSIFKKVWLVAGGLALASLVFTAGWGIGSGRITIGSIETLSPAPSSIDYSKVDEVYKTLVKNFDGDLTSEQLTDGMMKGLAEATNDPYTEYFNAKDAEAFNSSLNGTITGIGAQLGKTSDGNIEIISPVDGSPALHAGLKSHDIIAEVNKESTAGWSVDKAVSKIRGDKGTSVTLTVIRDGQQPFSVAITRDIITVPSVESEILPGNIGYLRISQFANNTGSLARQEAEKLTNAKVKGIILDLRDNGGGYVNASSEVASLWLDKGSLIYTEKRKNGDVLATGYASGDNILKGYKTIVLINGGSASASEILAGALMDNKSAVTLGEKSYGKGVVQNVIQLGGGAELKVTIASWYRPNGQSIDKKGISPDKAAPLDINGLKAGQDSQKNAAINELNKI